MAVLQMKRLYLCALKKDRKKILELLQRRGVLEIIDLQPEDRVFQKFDSTVAKSSLEKTIAVVKDAYDILNMYAPEQKSMLSFLNGRKEISLDEMDSFIQKNETVARIANRIISLSKEISETKNEIIRLETQIEILTPWVTFDIPMDFRGTKHTASYIGTVPYPISFEELDQKLSEVSPVSIEIISASKDQTCIFVLCKREKSDVLYEVLRSMEFSYPSIMFDKSPAQQLMQLNKAIEQARASISKAEEEIRSYANKRDELLFLQDFSTIRAEKYDAIGHLVESKNVFLLSGFIAARDVASITDELNSKFLLSVELEQPEEEEDVPVLLQNNGFSEPLEGIVNAYSPPGKGEVDPTMVMSLFYYLLYGLMLSDAGYGAIMAIACGFALIKSGKRMEKNWINYCKMYLFCGISAVFWGVLFSSYFGDVVDVVSETYFGHKVTIAPLWFLPMNEPMRMLTFSMLLGLIHLFTGLGMKLYQLLRKKDYKSMLYDVIFWFVLLGGAIVYLLSMQMMVEILGISFRVPGNVANIAGLFAILAAIGIVLTNGRESKNPFKRFLKGLYALYGISGYLSDVLSYSRLLALGLATGVIGMVINKMASMAGGGKVIGPFIFVIIFIIGHTLNLGINALGAYVHTNRLHYVEFFGKFYEGSGRLFAPFSNKTKYYKIKEKMKNEY